MDDYRSVDQQRLQQVELVIRLAAESKDVQAASALLYAAWPYPAAEEELYGLLRLDPPKSPGGPVRAENAGLMPPAEILAEACRVYARAKRIPRKTKKRFKSWVVDMRASADGGSDDKEKETT